MNQNKKERKIRNGKRENKLTNDNRGQLVAIRKNIISTNCYIIERKKNLLIACYFVQLTRKIQFELICLEME